jgi:MFS family permease
VLVQQDYDAVRISGSGELPPTGSGRPSEIDEDRLGGLGRATLRTLTALDRASTPPRHGPDSYVLLVSQVLPGWVLALLAGALLLPALAASIDAFARARRRQLAVTPWLRWVAAWIAPFLAGLALAELLAAVGATPVPPPAPVPPEVLPLDGAALAVLAGVGLAMTLAWLAARRLALWPDATLRDPAAPGAAVALMLVVSGASVLLWLLNPYAALLAVPAVHLWLLACLTDPPPPRRWRLAMVVAGAVAPLLVAIYYLFALNLDPLAGAWYLLLLVTGHHVGLVGSLLASVLLGAGLAAAQIARSAQPEPELPAESDRPRVYGPGGIAGPGSLGGTQSALRR